MKHLLILLLFVSQAHGAGLFRAESETLFSARDDEKSNLELPLYEFMSTSYMNEKRNFEFNSNFSLFTDSTRANSNKANLYILDAKFEAIPDFLNFRIGRSFDLQNTIGAASVDMISSELQLNDKRLRLGAFIGVERKTETYAPNPNATLWGGHINYNSDDNLPYFLTGKFVQRKNNSLANPIENLVQASARKALTASWSPELVADTVTNISKTNLDRVEAGVDLYPTLSSFAKARVLSYDVLPNSGVEQPIYSIFSQGRLYEGRLQFEKKLSAKWTASISAFFDNYLLQEAHRANGYGSEFEVKHAGDGYHLTNNSYFFKSYGGSVYGNRIGLQKGFMRNQEFYATADVTYYQKITSSKRFATNTELGWGRFLGKKFKFNFGGEFNSNNLLKYDLRAVAKLTFLLWSET